MRHGRSLLAVMVGLVVMVGAMATPLTAEADSESSGGMFVPIAPYRLVNTSTGLGGSDYPLAPQGVRSYDVLGHDGVPATGVGAVVVDIARLWIVLCNVVVDDVVDRWSAAASLEHPASCREVVKISV